MIPPGQFEVAGVSAAGLDLRQDVIKQAVGFLDCVESYGHLVFSINFLYSKSGQALVQKRSL